MESLVLKKENFWRFFKTNNKPLIVRIARLTTSINKALCIFSTELPHDSYCDFSGRPFQVIEVELWKYCQSVGNERGKKEKSNKSELWNHFSYKGLPYIFVVTLNSFEISNWVLKYENLIEIWKRIYPVSKFISNMGPVEWCHVCVFQVYHVIR